MAGSIPLAVRPGLVLAAEQELGITAGLQDRVIQVRGMQVVSVCGCGCVCVSLCV